MRGCTLLVALCLASTPALAADATKPHPHQGVVQAYTDVGWFKRCADIRGRSLASLPFGLYRGDTLVWSDQLERPRDLAWLDLRAFLFRTEIALALTARAYALKERSGRRMTWRGVTLHWPS